MGEKQRKEREYRVAEQKAKEAALIAEKRKESLKRIEQNQKLKYGKTQSLSGKISGKPKILNPYAKKEMKASGKEIKKIEKKQNKVPIHPAFRPGDGKKYSSSSDSSSSSDDEEMKRKILEQQKQLNDQL